MAAQTKVGYSPATGKTSLVDRMNLSIHLRKYIKLISRRWFILLLGAGIGTGFAWYKAKNMPDVFRAHSKIMIAPLLQTPVDLDRTKWLEEMAKFYNNQIEYMKSQAVLGRVYEKLKDHSSPFGAQPWHQIDAAQGMSASITMTVTSHDFEFARRFAEVWAQEFKAYKDSLKTRSIENQLKETQLELSRAREQLEDIRKKLQDLAERYPVGGASNRVASAQEQLNQLGREQLRIRTQRQLLENQTLEQIVVNANRGGTPEDSHGEPPDDRARRTEMDPLLKFAAGSSYADLKKRLDAREDEQRRNAETLKPRHPAQVELARQIEDLRRSIAIELKSLQERYDAQIASLKKQEESYNPLIAEVKSELQAALAEVQKYAQWEEQRSQWKRREAEQERIITTLEAAWSAMLRTPTEDEKLEIWEAGVGSPLPIGPDRRQIILNGLLIGLAVGFALIYFLHRLDDRLELAEDIEEELEEPVLGQVPQLDKSLTRDGVVLVTRLEQHNTFAEALRGVRSALLFGARETPKQVIVVTSAVPGDGKTTFTVNFAATLAKAGNKVLLVDADLRRGNIHQYFGLERENGLTEVLAGELHWQDVVKRSPLETLDMVTTGRLPGNPGELLISPITEKFIEDARKHYDHLLFDCPPLTSIDDTFCLLNLVDGLMFLVKAGHTSMRFAKNALAAVRHRGASIIGIVLNGITTDHPGYYYYYYYHDYYKSAQASAASGEKLPESRPATEMAPRRRAAASIDEAARVRAGSEAAPAVLDGQKKAEMFKARRAALKSNPAETRSEAPSPAPAPVGDSEQNGQSS